MPLHVDIRINDHLLNTLHIGRVSGGAGVTHGAFISVGPR